MKKLMFIALFLLTVLAYAQQVNPNGFDCNFQPGALMQPSPPIIGGLYKPESIDRYSFVPNAYFPVLIVYVQFLNDPGPDWTECVWHRNQAPNFYGTVIATQKQTAANWWNAYDENTQALSDYWMEVSRGKMHMVGQEVNVVLPHEVSYYDNYSNGIQMVMEDLFNALQSNLSINWPNYDKWSKDQNGVFQYTGDGYVDMMYVVGRSNPCSPYSPGWGYFRPVTPFESCIHSGGHVVYDDGLIPIRLLPEFGEHGSGFQISPGGCGNGVLYAPMDKWAMISFSEHEHGHYFFGWGQIGEFAGHQQYSKVNNYHGMEEYLSPYELIKLGYHTPIDVDYLNTGGYTVKDFVSFDQNSNSQILKVPIGDASRNEFFLIASRQHASKYDHLMWGDTAHGNPYRNVNQQYGKGIYIYHTYPGRFSEGYPWGIDMDIECADGLFDWVQDGYQHPDWSCVQNVEYYKRNSVVYNMNDNGGEVNQQLGNHDGLSIYNWFGIGKKEDPPCQYGDGIDMVFTNSTEVWTSREQQGDRWDAWNIGYNQVFSPYSSPSTTDWDNNGTGIFIYFQAQNKNGSLLKIYKAGQGYTEDEILALTPPSRPMGLTLNLTDCVNGYAHTILSWNQNMEPDMVNSQGNKVYGILKAWSDNWNTIPVEYHYVGNVVVPAGAVSATFTDYENIVSCGSLVPNNHFTRYKIVAYDKDMNGSVPSDFVSTAAYLTWWDPWNRGNHPTLPDKFSLEQNYPNPFNPSTEIKYGLPSGANVTIKIYNTLGEEIKILVNNEYKDAGYYTATFNGSGFASGVYFYTITAGTFRDTKKMVLIK